MSHVVNTLRGEFAATLAGERIVFDTTLATIAAIEERCGAVAIVEAVNRAVFGRRAADHLALVAGALIACGHIDAEAVAAKTSLAEAEAFILALMGALGFTLARRDGADAGGTAAPSSDAAPAPGAEPPFPPASGASAGPAGAASPSAP